MKFSVFATLFSFTLIMMINALPSSFITQESNSGATVNEVSGPGAIANSHSESITTVTSSDGTVTASDGRVYKSDGSSILADSAFLLNAQGQIAEIALAKYL